MKQFTVAHKYARALFNAALEEGNLDRVADDMAGLLDLTRSRSQEGNFARFLVSPEVSTEEKIAFLRRVFGPRLDPMTVNFIILLLEKKRILAFLEVSEVFTRMVEEHRGILKARVVSVIPLAGDQERRLKTRLDFLTGKNPKSARTEFAYFNDDGDLVAYRYNNWKAVFAEQKKPGGFPVWYEPFTSYRVPKLFHLRMDPYERADVVSDQYDQWRVENAYLMAQLTFHAAAFLETFKEYPPSQRPASFSIDQIRKGVDKVIDESFRKRGIE